MGGVCVWRRDVERRAVCGRGLWRWWAAWAGSKALLPQKQRAQMGAAAQPAGARQHASHTKKATAASADLHVPSSALSPCARPARRKVVVQYREDCRQLDSDPRLASSSGAKEQQEAMQVRAAREGGGCPPPALATQPSRGGTAHIPMPGRSCSMCLVSLAGLRMPCPCSNGHNPSSGTTGAGTVAQPVHRRAGLRC